MRNVVKMPNWERGRTQKINRVEKLYNLYLLIFTIQAHISA